MACSRFIGWLVENKKIISLALGWVVVVASALASQIKDAKIPMKIVIAIFTFLAFLAFCCDYIHQICKDRRRGARCSHMKYVVCCWRRLDGSCVCYPEKLIALIGALLTVLSAIADLYKTIFEKVPKINITPGTIVGATLTIALTMYSNFKKKKNQPSSREKMKGKVMELWKYSTNTTDSVQKTSTSLTFLKMKLAEGVAEGTEGSSELLKGINRVVECAESLVRRSDKQQKMIEELVEQNTVAEIERKQEGN